MLASESTSRALPSATTWPSIEQQQPVGVLGGQGEVVHRRDRRSGRRRAAASRRAQAPAAGGRGRARWSARRGAGSARPGRARGRARRVAARRRSVSRAALGERAKREPCDRALGGQTVGARLGCQVADVRRPSKQHVLGHGQSRRRLGVLRYQRDSACDLAAAARRERARRGGSVRRTRRGRRGRAGSSSCRRRWGRSAPPTRRAGSWSRPRGPPGHCRALPRPRAPPRPRSRTDPSRRPQDDGEEGGAEERGHDADRQLRRRQNSVRAITSARTRKPAPASSDSGTTAR